MIPRILRGCLLILILSLSLASCGHGNPQVPAIDIRLYAGSPEKGGIERAQDKEVISCVEPRFNEFTCLTYSDLRRVYEILLQCRDWDGISMISARSAFRKNPDVVKKAAAVK